ncbi:17.3 kDa class II heat shock protein-like [Salvia miltiorrhiza]|uniref:17.3 kDa class II heat shock protein-like n=1 Tax=Salvia miltiorrhiza TaxID=226208 RepID=UPI0025ABAF3A|nr:17.3 kDa class II heat shock protein-like [Salvia miltiorrhiza]
MDMRHLGGVDNVLLSTLLDLADEGEKPAQSNPSRAYVRDAKAMAATPADVKEYPASYAVVVDMPGIAAADITVQLEDDNVLVVSGERRREKEEGVKYLRMERRHGKFMRKFPLPENADVDAISAVCRDGVLTVTVRKLPPPEPKKPKTIEVKVGG